MDLHLADVPRFHQPQVSPRLPTVVRPVDTVAPRRALAVVLLSSAGVEDVRVRVGDGHVAERAHRHELEDVFPRVAAIRGLPQAAGSRRNKDRRRISR